MCDSVHAHILCAYVCRSGSAFGTVPQTPFPSVFEAGYLTGCRSLSKLDWLANKSQAI